MRWIDDNTPLPAPGLALGLDSQAPGLLCAGGRVTPQRLIEAYSQGIFPWYSEGQPVLWWSPAPRMVLPTASFHLSHSLKKTLRRFSRSAHCSLRFDGDFEAVIQACAQTPRSGQGGTWIVPDMISAYCQAHDAGFVHCVETIVEGRTVGGLYFVSLGRMVFGESMFAWATDASKIALAGLVAACRQRDIAWVDCQQNTPHLASFGAHEVSRNAFEAHLQRTVSAPPVAEWTYDADAWASLLSS